MVYGDPINVQQMVFGGAKTTVPVIVTRALQIMTTKINSYLAISNDMDQPPQIITDIAELGAAGMVKQGDSENPHYWYSAALKMLSEYRNDSKPTQKGLWGHLKWV